MYERLFWTLSKLGRPFGGIPPRRIVHWLGEKAFSDSIPAPSDFVHMMNIWGDTLNLHPYYHIDRSIIALGTYDAPLHRFIERRVMTGMCCFDIGANIGEVSLHMARKVGPTGRVYSFEPAPLVSTRLTENIELNNRRSTIAVYTLALSDRTGDAEMSLATAMVCNQGQGSLVNRQNARLTERVRVPTQTIDEFIKREVISKIDLIKVDIQGSEPLLLAGGERVFGELGPDLLVEVSPEDLVGLGLDSRDLLRQLEGYGYSIRELNPDGTPGGEVKSARVDAHYQCENVYCSKSGM